MLRTAALENPQLTGQLILVPSGIATEELARLLEREGSQAADAAIRYENGVRQALRWAEIEADVAAPPVAFRDEGVYLITGGLGGLGLLFAREILQRTRKAKVVLTGRSALTPEKQALLDGFCAPATRGHSFRCDNCLL